MTNSFAPVEGPSRALSYLAAEAIRNRIERGELAPGDRLPAERVLTEQLGVSRTALREALKMLESMGMLEARTGRGRFVVQYTDDRASVELVRNWLHAHRADVEHLNVIRTAIEQLALEATPAHERARMIERLRSILAEAEDAVRRADSVRAAQLDADFHRALCSATDNRPLQALAFGLIDAAQQAATAVYAVPAAARNSLRQHADLIEWLELDSVGNAQGVLREHFVSSIREAASRG
jgi:GntR family transcriptional regulator, transcriptional repressor for pyruvate dehydrogenase complex